MNDKLLEILREKFNSRIIDSGIERAQVSVTINPESLLEVVEFLKTDPELKYDFLLDLCGVDYPKRDKRFEMVYHFYSPKHNHRMRVKVPLQGRNPTVNSLTGLFKAANWPERETYDMFGIKFRNHPNLKRILNVDNFSGFPLRKDFPVKGRERGGFPRGKLISNKVAEAVKVFNGKR